MGEARCMLLVPQKFLKAQLEAKLGKYFDKTLRASELSFPRMRFIVSWLLERDQTSTQAFTVHCILAKSSSDMSVRLNEQKNKKSNITNKSTLITKQQSVLRGVGFR